MKNRITRRFAQTKTPIIQQKKTQCGDFLTRERKHVAKQRAVLFPLLQSMLLTQIIPRSFPHLSVKISSQLCVLSFALLGLSGSSQFSTFLQSKIFGDKFNVCCFFFADEVLLGPFYSTHIRLSQLTLTFCSLCSRCSSQRELFLPGCHTVRISRQLTSIFCSLCSRCSSSWRRRSRATSSR